MSESLPGQPDPSLLPAESLGVLMIALGDEVLTGLRGDARERHIEYAERVGHLHIIAYSPRSRNLARTAIGEKLTVYPTRSATRLSFIWDAYRLGVRICQETHIDVITTQDPFTTGLVGMLLKQRFGVPLHIQNHSDFFDNRVWIAENPVRYGFFNWLGKRIIQRGDVLRTVNEAEKAKYITMGVDPARVYVIPVPVLLGRFSPVGPPGEEATLRAMLGIPSDGRMLLWVGRPVFFKRVPLLIEVLARLRATHSDVHLVLVGDFAARPDICAEIARLDLNECAHLAGAVSHERLPSYYRLCDIYVHSSVYEGFGLVMVEAAASGKPVVSTHTAGAQEIVVDGKTGLLCRIENVGDLVAKLVTLLDDPDRAAAMGAEGRAHVLEHFNRERIMQAIIHSWQQAAAKR